MRAWVVWTVGILALLVPLAWLWLSPDFMWRRGERFALAAAVICGFAAVAVGLWRMVLHLYANRPPERRISLAFAIAQVAVPAALLIALAGVPVARWQEGRAVARLERTGFALHEEVEHSPALHELRQQIRNGDH